MTDTFAMLQELLAQDQFELLFSEEEKPENLRLVYLMNDAVESFLVFQKVRTTGSYRKDYEGELDATLSRSGEEYVLSVWQGDSVFTIFFEELALEVHCYDYGETGHFWVKGWEYLRRLEYLIAIVRDKCDYLGEPYCSGEEQKLAALADFPPLNYCSYPAVPERYLVRREEAEGASPEALEVMTELAEGAGDATLLRALWLYRKRPHSVLIRKWIAGMLRKWAHAGVVDTICVRLKEESRRYPRRSFGPQEDARLAGLLKMSEQQKAALEKEKITAEVVREERFAAAEDGIENRVYLMVYGKKTRGNRICNVKEIQ
ncbi:MAG: DUF3878 family protein [Lachnospiraceae bacterium]|nr:DUF3878 family protein [Lachnospiraceae bacterium]